MDEVDQFPSNQEAETAPIERRPGPPKGAPKPPGSGRKPGTPNRITKDIKQLALKDAPAMLRGLKKLAETATDEKTKLAAIVAYLDRAVGKPMAPTELTGRDGEPLHPEPDMSRIDIGRRIAFALASAAREVAPEPEPAATPAEPPAGNWYNRNPDPTPAPEPAPVIIPPERMPDDWLSDEDLQMRRHRQSIEDKCRAGPTVVHLRKPR